MVEYGTYRESFKEVWSDGVFLNNPLGPSYVSYGHNGLKEYEEWREDNKYHNEKGPARIWGDKPEYSEFYLDGVGMSFTKWLARVEEVLSESQIINLKKLYGKLWTFHYRL